MATVSLDVISDPVCPWCWIGINALKTLLSTDETAIHVRMRPFLLYRSVPPGGLDRRKVYEKKMPDPEQKAAIMNALDKAAAEVGITLHLSNAARIPDAAPAQHVIRALGDGKAQFRFAFGVYEAYWSRAAEIDSPDVLSGVAEAVGIDPEQVRKIAEEPCDDTREEADAIGRAGVTGAPTYIVNGETGFAGALPAEKLRMAIDHAANLNTSNSTSAV
ncbi:MAG: DsbA family protein [Pseudomonadota bacterium]